MIAALIKSSVTLRAPLQAAARRQFSARKPSSHETVEPTKLVGITLTRNQKIVLGVALAGGCAAESTFWYNYFFGKSEEAKDQSAQLAESQE